MSPMKWSVTSLSMLSLVGVLCTNVGAQQGGGAQVQDVYLLCEGVDATKQVLLTLNNNYPTRKTIALRVYTTDGQSAELPSISLKPDESRLAPLNQVLHDKGITAPLGYVRVTYDGELMGVGAQLTLYPKVGDGGLDSARSLSADFISARRTAVAWFPPQSTAVLAYSNVSDTAITVDATTSEHQPEHFIIGPHATHIAKVTHEAQDRPFFSDLISSGSIDSLRVSGYIAPVSGAPLPIRYYDPAAATTSHLTAIGISSSGTSHVAIYNTTTSEYSVTPELRPATDMTSQPVVLPAVPVPAGKAIYLDVGSALNSINVQSASLATLTLSTSAPIGGLVGSLSEENIEALAIEDIPLRTSNPQAYMRGAYPLRWDGDYRNKAMVTNTSLTQKTVSAYVIADNATFNFAPVILQPFATHIYDIDSIREDQTQDFKGTRIPMSARSGKFHWTGNTSEQGPGLLGRMQVTSRSERRASSFSCGTICPGPTVYPVFDINLWGTFSLGSTTVSHPSKRLTDAYGNVSWQPMSANSSGYSSSNSSVLTMVGDLSTTQVNLSARSVGTSTTGYRQFTYSNNTRLGGECMPNPVQIASLYSPSNVVACQTPTGESTQPIRQAATTIYSPTATDYIQTLILGSTGASVAENGSTIDEAENAPGTDSCYFPGSAYAPDTMVSGGHWIVGGITSGFPESQVVTPGSGQWGPDIVGFQPGGVRYYQQNRPMRGLPVTCSVKVFQQITSTCPGGLPTAFIYNSPITITLDATGVTNCRENVCSAHFAYQ